MKNDSKGIPDVCRETPPVPDQAALDYINFVKIQTNDLIEQCRMLQQARPDAEAGRLFSLAISAYEEAALWAVKAMTTEGWKP